MTKRSDKGTKGGSVITGLRLEGEPAKLLRETAVRDAAGNIAELARFYIRRGVGFTAREANQVEEEQPKPERLCGLALDAMTLTRLKMYAAREGLNVYGSARHLIRLGLGYPKADSMKREAGFAAIAEAWEGRRDTFHGAGK